MSTDNIDESSPMPKIPRHQCAMCLKCNRNGTIVTKQSQDPDNFIPSGLLCPSCNLPTFDIVDRSTVEFSSFGDTKLTTLIFDCCFDEALKRVKRFPKEAGTLGKSERSESALHWAVCNRAPLELIRELVKAAPDMVTYAAGWHEQGTPIEVFLRMYRYPGIHQDTLATVRTLLEGSPKAATSLYRASWCLVRALYEAMDDEETYPDRIPVDLGFVEEEIPDEDLTNLGREMRARTKITFRAQSKMMLDVLILIAKAGYYGSTADCNDKPLLHALVAFPYQLRVDDLNWTSSVPDRVVKLACRLNPDEMSLADGDGNLPLHLAVSQREPYREKDEWELRAIQENEIDVEYGLKEYGLWWLLEIVPRDRNCKHIDLQKDDYDDHNSTKIELLLEKYPEAVKVKNTDGDLPLHLAIKARKTLDIVLALIEAYPDAVHEHDGEGNTCLHLLAQQMPGSLNMKGIFAKYDLSDYDLVNDFIGGQVLGMHLMSTDKMSILKLLVQKYPEARSTHNNEGLLPYQCFECNEAQYHLENGFRFIIE